MKFSIFVAGALTAALCAGVANAADGPVKIAVLTDMSSLYADATGKGSVEAARMAAEDAGPVLGQAVQVISGDHQNKPDVGTGLAEKWYDTDGVDMITDVPTSSVALAVEAISRDKHKIVMFSGPASSDITGKACSPYAVH